MPQKTHDPSSSDPQIARLRAVGTFIKDNGFATFVATILLVWLLFVRKESVSAADVSALRSSLTAHATEMTARGAETTAWTGQMLRFAYLSCLHEATSQHDRDVCEAVVR